MTPTCQSHRSPSRPVLLTSLPLCCLLTYTDFTKCDAMASRGKITENRMWLHPRLANTLRGTRTAVQAAPACLMPWCTSACFSAKQNSVKQEGSVLMPSKQCLSLISVASHDKTGEQLCLFAKCLTEKKAVLGRKECKNTPEHPGKWKSFHLKQQKRHTPARLIKISPWVVSWYVLDQFMKTAKVSAQHVLRMSGLCSGCEGLLDLLTLEVFRDDSGSWSNRLKYLVSYSVDHHAI